MKITYGDKQWDTYAEIDGVEQDSVTVFYNTSPAEREVNWEAPVMSLGSTLKTRAA